MTYQLHTPLDIRTIGTNGTVPLGSFTHDGIGELAYVAVHLLKVGVSAGTESMIVRLHTSTNFANIYAQSTARLITEFSTDTNFSGWLRFDFNRENMIDNQLYHITLALTGYT